MTLLLLFFFFATPAFAACSSPAGAQGEIIYNANQKIMQYCDNTNWIAMGGSIGSGDITTGLVGWWKLDESSGTTAADSSGSGNTGANGTNDRVDIGDPANGSLDFGTGSFSYGM